MTVQKTTYITVAVRFVDGKPLLDLGDDGEPGLWGDTYLFDEETEEDEWTFDMDAQSAAYDHLLRLFNRSLPVCSECGRMFDLADENDAQEWHYGHDCES